MQNTPDLPPLAAPSQAARLHLYHDRRSAGRELATALRAHTLAPHPLVLALPRGGVPVGLEVARALDCPLDVLVVRKLGAPGQPELAIGAIAAGGIIVREPLALSYAPRDAFDRIIERERAELVRREQCYRAGLGPLDLKDRNLILVDDGLATGATMLAAVRAVRLARAASVLVAAPVASEEAVALLRSEADAIVIGQIPASLMSIGEWYEHFEQLEDEDVCALLQEARAAHPSRGAASV